MDNTQLYVETLFINHKDDNTIMLHCKNIDVVNQDGETTLHVAIRKQNCELIARLIKHGAKCNIMSKRGKTSLLLAVETHDLNIISLFTGPEMFSADYSIYFDYFPKLVSHFRSGCFHRMKPNVDINYTTSKFGITPLHMAIMIDNINGVDMLLKCKINVNITDINGDTPLMYAVYMKKHDIISLLLKNKANPAIKNNKDNKAKDFCALSDETTIQKLDTAESFMLVVLAHKHDPNSYLHHYNIARDVFKCVTRLVWKYITN